jgi:hypothetical protein
MKMANKTLSNVAIREYLNALKFYGIRFIVKTILKINYVNSIEFCQVCVRIPVTFLY